MSDFSVVTSEEEWWIFSSLIIRVRTRYRKTTKLNFHLVSECFNVSDGVSRSKLLVFPSSSAREQSSAEKSRKEDRTDSCSLFSLVSFFVGAGGKGKYCLFTDQSVKWMNDENRKTRRKRKKSRVQNARTTIGFVIVLITWFRSPCVIIHDADDVAHTQTCIQSPCRVRLWAFENDVDVAHPMISNRAEWKHATITFLFLANRSNTKLASNQLARFSPDTMASIYIIICCILISLQSSQAILNIPVGKCVDRSIDLVVSSHRIA